MGIGKDLLIASNKSESLHGGKHADILYLSQKRASRSGDINMHKSTIWISTKEGIK